MKGQRNDFRMQLKNLLGDLISLGKPVPKEVIHTQINHGPVNIRQIIKEKYLLPEI